MKFLLSLLFLISSVVFYAQQLGNNTFYLSGKDSSSIVYNLSSEIYYGSSIFNNEFLDKFIDGGFIDADLKNEALGKAKALNHLGGAFNVSVNY